MDHIIKIQNVNLWYEKGKSIEVHALNNITLNIERGDYVAFFGPSGCGKTTLLYALSGIDRFQDGTVLVNNQDLSLLSDQELAIFRQTKIGIVFQQFNLIPSLTVLKNVALPIIFTGATSLIAERKALQLLERLDLVSYAHRYPHELSGGQQQRVGIARALANDPPIIIADEPLGNLDSINAQKVLAFLKELHEKDGRTIIMVTHEAWSLRDVKTIFHMKDGAIVSSESIAGGDVAATLSKHVYTQLSAVQGSGIDTPESQERISARILANVLLRGYSIDEIERFESYVNRRFNNTITQDAFYTALHTRFRDGGVGLWKRKAKRVVSYVDGIMDIRNNVKHVYERIEKHVEASIVDDVREIRVWLLRDYNKILSGDQIAALDQVIADRIRGYNTAEQVAELLDLSRNKYGVGLSFRASQIMAQKLELILNSDHESIYDENNT